MRERDVTGAQDCYGEKPGCPWREVTKRRVRRNGEGGVKAVHVESGEVKSGQREWFQNVSARDFHENKESILQSDCNNLGIKHNITSRLPLMPVCCPPP